MSGEPRAFLRLPPTDDGSSEVILVAVDQVAAVVPLTRRNSAGITFCDGSEVFLSSGATVVTSKRPSQIGALLRSFYEVPS